MNEQSSVYGNLCSLFYDTTKKFAPKKEVDFYASFMTPAGRVLEAMSGSGRLQIPLMQRGFVVDGVDNSPIMLDRCRKRSFDLGLVPLLFEQSVENLLLPYTYHTVTIAIGSFQLIVDRAQALVALKNMRAHMCAGGNLLIELFTPEYTADVRTASARIDERSVIRLTARSVFDNTQRRVDGYCCYDLIIDGVVQCTENELIPVTWYTDAEFSALLGNAGFTVVRIYEESFRPGLLSRIVLAHAF